MKPGLVKAEIDGPGSGVTPHARLSVVVAGLVNQPSPPCVPVITGSSAGSSEVGIPRMQTMGVVAGKVRKRERGTPSLACALERGGESRLPT